MGEVVFVVVIVKTHLMSVEKSPRAFYLNVIIPLQKMAK